MLFAMDDKTDDGEILVKSQGCAGNYVFRKCVRGSEGDIYQRYRECQFAAESARRQDLLRGLNVNTVPERLFPHTGGYIIPKMFEYYPFLDCDEPDVLAECELMLAYDNVPYVVYESSPKHYWVFCDVPSDFDSALKFIRKYPCDHRYPWIASYKREFCVRAYPKKGIVPVRISAPAKDMYSRDFRYWVSEFDRYWTSSDVVKYVGMIKTINSI